MRCQLCQSTASPISFNLLPYIGHPVAVACDECNRHILNQMTQCVVSINASLVFLRQQQQQRRAAAIAAEAGSVSHVRRDKTRCVRHASLRSTGIISPSFHHLHRRPVNVSTATKMTTRCKDAYEHYLTTIPVPATPSTLFGLLLSLLTNIQLCLGLLMRFSAPVFLADRTNGRAYATVLRLSVVCDVMYCG